MMEEFAELAPHEDRLDGAWIETPDGTVADEVDQRIFWLVRRRLRAVATAHGGWDQLFVDPRDDRYWELTFPQGTLYGGGPRRLAVLSADDAAIKYGSAAARSR